MRLGRGFRTLVWGGFVVLLFGSAVNPERMDSASLISPDTRARLAHSDAALARPGLLADLNIRAEPPDRNIRVALPVPDIVPSEPALNIPPADPDRKVDTPAAPDECLLVDECITQYH